jgi:hypothetical protein
MIKDMEEVEGRPSSGEKAKNELLQLDKIKPADRVTFLLNYLYLTIRNH